MKLVKYFLQKKAVTILLLVLILAGGLFSYIKMGKLEDAPFTIKQALVLTPYPGASPSEVQSQVTDILEESIQSLSELYYLKTENRTGLSKITVYVGYVVCLLHQRVGARLHCAVVLTNRSGVARPGE